MVILSIFGFLIAAGLVVSVILGVAILTALIRWTNAGIKALTCRSNKPIVHVIIQKDEKEEEEEEEEEEEDN